MPQTIPWHEDDSFWATWEPTMFSNRRCEATPVEVDGIVSLLNIQLGLHVLDLCCGPGRH